MNRAILIIGAVMGALIAAVGVLIVVLVVTGGDGGGGGEPRSADELRLRGPEPLTLDPHITQDADSAVYVVEIFGGLLTLNPDLQLEADLAQEIPSEENGGKVVNQDGTVTYTFKLRPDARFHDRKPVTAETVKFSLERAADPATQSLVAEFFLGDIVGVKEKLAGDAEEISGVRIVDDSTIEITIERDLPSFLFKLTYPTAFVVDPQQVQTDDNWTRRPNGTGPYKLEQWRLGERIVLEANNEYHLGAPIVQTVRYLLTGSAIVLYEADDVDVAGVALDDLERIQDPADPLHSEYHNGTRLAVDYIGFNTNAPPFDDLQVREAFARAIDREQIARVVLQGALPVANSILMPGMDAYDPNAAAPEFDPELAQQLLADSEYGGPEGLPALTLAQSGAGATTGPATQAVVEMWRDNLGVDVQVEQADASTFFQDVDEGRHQMFLLAWIMDYPDEENLLNIHFDSESPNNDTFYSNPEVDALLREALTETNEQRRVELYQQAEQMILADVPWFPLFF
ncbi:MAG: ABC transporter substrate-binding protein, partial [Dehalococcoidia bacterium]|nr:ABC transporter substrate-binding protein [Dehalococcoidia bacterium]